MVKALTKQFDGKEFLHDMPDVFTRKEDAQVHSDWLKMNHNFIKTTKVENKGDGVYWVWWSYR